MDTWAVGFLGIIALSSLVQAGFLVALAMHGRRLSRRLDELQTQLDRDLKPALASFTRVGRNLEEVTDLAVLQARRIDDVIADTLEKVQETTSLVQKVVVRPLGPLMDLAAFLRGLKRGVEVYRQLGGLDDHAGRARARRFDADDEHLFI